MAFHHIHLTGPSGSGTTTLARALGKKLGYRVLDADDYFWLPTLPPYQDKREKAERLSLLFRDYHAQPSCILSGSVVDWSEELEQSFDLIIYLWLPVELRLERLRRRELARNGMVDMAFLDWAALYDTGDLSMRSRASHEAWLTRTRGKLLRLEEDFSVEERVQRTMQFMTQAGESESAGLVLQ